MQDQDQINWEKIIDVLTDQASIQELTEEEKGIVEKISETGNDKDILYALQNLDEKTAWNKIKDELEKPAVIPISRRHTYRAWAVAAAVLLVISTGAFLFLTGDKEILLAETKQSKTEKVNEIHPGSDKAILTLADGSTIVLDSTAKGTITKQGQVTIINLGGQLAYNTDNTGSKEVMYNTITTPRGGQYQLILADGTKVWLNAASSLRFPTAFVGDERTVDITGEGYFEVAHDAKMPFYVSKNDVQVQVLGTQFNVNAYEDETDIKITLLEGSVKVKLLEKSIILKPGQQARAFDPTFNNGVSKLQAVNNVDIEHVVAWKNGYFSFDNANVKTIMQQLSRWYNIEVMYEGDVTDQKFSGKVYRNMNLQEMLEVLSFSRINIKINGKKVTVIADER